jgi:hypothetical protein
MTGRRSRQLEAGFGNGGRLTLEEMRFWWLRSPEISQKALAIDLYGNTLRLYAQNALIIESAGFAAIGENCCTIGPCRSP